MVSYIETVLFETKQFYNWALFFQVFHHLFCQIKSQYRGVSISVYAVLIRLCKALVEADILLFIKPE